MRSIFLTLLFIPFSTFAQTTFQRVLDSDGSSYRVSARAASGELYMAGFFFNAPTDGIVVNKYAADGTLNWSNVFRTNDPLQSLFPEDMIALVNGNLVVTGRMSSFTGDDSAFVTMLDATGDVQWMRTFGSLPGTFTIKGAALAEALNGDIIALGEFQANIGFHLYLTRFSNTGVELWSKEIAPTTTGNTNRAGALLATQTGDILVAAVTAQATEGSWTMLLDGAGNVQWVKKYDTNLSGSSPVPRRVVFSAAGYTLFYPGDFSGFSLQGQLMDINTSGDLQINKLLEIVGATAGGFTEMRVTQTGNYILSGGNFDFSAGSMWAAMIDPLTTPLWAMEYGLIGQAIGNTILRTADGGVFLGGYGQQDSLVESGSTPVQGYLVKANDQGQTGFCEAPLTWNSAALVTTSSTYTQNVGPLPSFTAWVSATAINEAGATEVLACTSVGINELTYSEPVVYPIPAAEFIRIDGLSGQWFHRILDEQGKECLTATSTGTSHTLDIGSLKEGMYFVLSTDGIRTHASRVPILR